MQHDDDATGPGQIALYYRFTPLADPEAVRLWQRELCTRLGLTGRIIVSAQGINGTVGGPRSAVRAYVRATGEHPALRGLDVKYSAGSAADFPRLSVKVRPELVAFGAPDAVVITPDGVEGTGTHLTPDALDALVAEREAAGDPVVFFDGRNAVEAAIGRFRGAVVPDVEHTRDFLAELDSGAHDHLKDRAVVTYCTGGVRCEVLSALMRQRGFREVYQLDGGIVRYGEARGDAGLWQGELAVFDRRQHTAFTDDAETIGRCEHCGEPTSELRNCTDPSCRTLAVVCDACHAADPERICDACRERSPL